MIAIKDMEMPKNCSDCDFCHGHICKRTGTDIIINPKGNCSLIEIVTCKDCKNNKNGVCPNAAYVYDVGELPRANVIEREKINKAIKIAKDSISECFELGLDERAFGMREILNIFEENIVKLESEDVE